MKDRGGQRIRTFLAIEVASPIQAALLRLKDELAATGAAVRWVRDDGLHATVKFLGPVAPDLFGRVRQALSVPIGSFPAFPVQVGGLGVFPTLHRPRVLWVGLNASELAHLARLVDAAVAPLGFPTESRPFRAHITLGRIKGQRGWSRLEEALKTHWSDVFGASDIEQLTGFRSDLHRDGAVYTKLWTIPLAAHRGEESHDTGRES